MTFQLVTPNEGFDKESVKVKLCRFGLIWTDLRAVHGKLSIARRDHTPEEDRCQRPLSSHDSLEGSDLSEVTNHPGRYPKSWLEHVRTC